MCCFSKPVPWVAETKIFARAWPDGRQALVYAMDFAAAEELAMILPIPVPPAPPEDAVRFVDLSGYDRFFDDLEKAFPRPLLEPTRDGGVVAAVPRSARLKVHHVGDFEASFVPTQADFDRLDPRFRLDPAVWARLPRYADWGFAVFKLKPKLHEPGLLARLLGPKPARQTVHPMAFTFPSRTPQQLFFPTVHVHDGVVHEEASFDHVLFAQAKAEGPDGWERSAEALGSVMDAARTEGLVDPAARCWRRSLRGSLPNRDQTLELAA